MVPAGCIDSILDISRYQVTPDMARVKAAGELAVLVKATQGVGSADPEHARNVADGLAAGLLIGSYHFLTSDAPAAQMAWFLAHHQGSVAMLDVEAGAGATVAIAAACAEILTSKLGRPPIIYIGQYGPTNDGAGLPNAILARCPLMLPAYSASPPRLPAGWDRWLMWQYTGTGTCPGVTDVTPYVTAVDRSCFAGTPTELAAFWATGALPSLTVLRGA